MATATTEEVDKTKETVKIENINEDEESDDDMPDLETPDAGLKGAEAKAGGDKESKESKQSRSEKKSRKAMQKLGLKPVPGINRVTLKGSNNVLYAIGKPDVFRSSSSDTYIIFGKIEDFSSNPALDAVKKFAKQPNAEEKEEDEVPALVEAETAPKATTKEPAAAAAKKEEKSDEPVDETGIEAKDIELVMSQGNVSRPVAVRALKKTNGDIVNAIMELTMS